MSDLAEFLNFKWKSNVHGRIAYIIKLPKIKRYYDLLYTSWPKMTARAPVINPHSRQKKGGQAGEPSGFHL